MTTHDFMAGNYQAQVAIYCGSIPKLKSGCKSSRGGSIDSTLQLHGNRWVTTDEASVLKTQSCLWGSKGEPPDVSSLESWDSRNGLQKNTDSTIMNGSSQTPNAQPKYSFSKLEINSAAMETAQIKDKLKKRRMSEGLLASKKGLLDKAVSKEPDLKPAISRSASQRLLVSSKPMPPIQSIPDTPETNRAQETEQQARENTSGSLQVEGVNAELTSTQQIMHGPDENPKKSLGAALIPPIPKLAKACEENSQKAAELFPSLPRTECAPLAIDECPKTRSLLKSGNGEDNNQKTLETGSSEPAFQNGFPAPCKVVGGSLASVLPLATSYLCLAKEDLLSNPYLLKDDEWKESNGRVCVCFHLFAFWHEGQGECKAWHLAGGSKENITRRTETGRKGYWECFLEEICKDAQRDLIMHGPDENPKKSLGAALIPPIPKLAKACEENSQKAAELFPSLPRTECAPLAIDECPKTRCSPGRGKPPVKSRTQGLPYLGKGPLQWWWETVPTKGCSGKDHGANKQLIPTGRDSGNDQLFGGSSWLNHNGATPVTLNLSNPCRASVGMALRKRVNRPSLPSIPVISQESNFLRHASANSLPANLQHSPEWEEDLVNRDAFEIRPLSHPEHELTDALKWLSSNDWHLKEKGLFNIICLATCHSEVLQGRLHDVSLAATKEVSNLRSKVSRFAIGTLAELFRAMKKHMDQEVEEISRVLLQKAGDTSDFIQKAADQSLGIMAQSVTPSRAMTALMANGVTHRNPLIRKCAAGHLLTVMEQIGAEKLLSGNRESTELLVQTLVKMAQDCHQDTRCYGRKMLNMLMCHSKFDGYLKQNVPSHDLRDVMAAIKQKGTEDSASQATSAKSYRGSKNGSLTISLDSLSSAEGSTLDVLNFSQPSARCSSLRNIEVMEQLKELNKLLVAKEFQIRIHGIALLMDHCKKNPHFVSSNIVQIFDTFTPRLQDSNKKVNQYALESVVSMIPVLKNGFNPVLFSVMTIVMDNLNSKNSGIYSAAVKVLDTMITYLDNLLLLQIFASRVRFLTGRALQDITDHLAGLVAVAYPRKPQVVERLILPVLWYFLNNMIGNGVLPGKSGNVRTVVSKLAQSLHKQMGLKLEEYVCNQPQHVIKLFQDLLDMDRQ
ncbi:PREDICTED: protein FAM179A [Thamnophis sirtalis]|uniref:Protein FAM179A n=1 Tax=Thamnophis sirtalis TaxID=35019 RepID=A0A6I9XA80_9SAUR|nr:PREDICTED: protein FAM179A [Thamnophis sirtalis]